MLQDAKKIEKAYKKGQKTMKLDDKYKIDFQDMIQFRIEVRTIILGNINKNKINNNVYRTETDNEPSSENNATLILCKVFPTYDNHPIVLFDNHVTI